MDSIHIQNFAGLRDVVIQTGPITVLIGPQASGKSIVAKLLYFFRETIHGMRAAAKENRSANEYRAERTKRFFRYFPQDAWEKASFSIVYKTNGLSLSVTYDAKQQIADEKILQLEWSPVVSKLLTRFSNSWQDLSVMPDEDEQSDPAERRWREDFDKALVEDIGEQAKFEPIFIPAGRAFFSQLRNRVFRELESGEEPDPFLVAFGAAIERSKTILETKGFYDTTSERGKKLQPLRDTFAQILRADLLRFEKTDFLEFSDGRRVRLQQASSGQQEALPLLLALVRFVTIPHVSGRSVHIEEPEAHLFPTTQKQIVELMAKTYRDRSAQISLAITTHSPYILTSLNNLLEAGRRYKLADKSTTVRLQSIIPKTHALYPGEVLAYGLGDGHAVSIIDPETNLIDAALIDQVSTQIAVQFDQLLWPPQ